jgi:phosphomannomutase
VKTTKFEKGVSNGTIEITDTFNDYIDAILNMIDTNVIKSRGLKLLLDPMYGVSKISLQTILLTARCRTDIINDRHDTLFGGRLPSPSAATLTKLKDIVIEKEYDLGIATDGDADRLGIIDDAGNFIHPNDIMVLLYYYLLKNRGWKGGVVRNIATTHLLDRIAKAFGEKCYEVPVGFKHISSKMEETNAMIGGESSGGLTIRGHIKGKDGIFAASLLVEAICATNKKISEMLSEIHKKFGHFYTAESDMKFREEDKLRLNEMLYKEKSLPDFGYSIDRISYKDGVKVYFENDGWIIARFSGTEPLLRIFSEMSTQADAKKINKIMRDFLNPT